MSDQDPASDPADRAYAEAEALLDDAAARAARRARVLGAVAREGAAAPAAPQAANPAPAALARPRPAWARGGWLAAACVAGLSLLVAVRLNPPISPEPPPPVGQTAAPAPAGETARDPVAAAPPAAGPASAPPAPPPAAPAAAPRAEARSARDAVVAEASPPPPVQAAPAPAAPPPSANAASAAGGRLASPPSAARAASAPPAMEAAPAAPEARAARLRAAAAAGRTAELTALLAEGTPVDAADEKGETALMKTVQANRPAAAALLRRHGADPDLENRAGASAREMAESVGNPALDRALEIAP